MDRATGARRTHRLIGRDELLAAILGAPSGATVVVEAEAGVGLTTLLEEAARQLAGASFDVGVARPVDRHGPAYGAVAHLLHHPVPGGDDAVRAVAEDLAGGDGRRALVIDRGELLDPASAAVLRSVAAGGSALVVVGGHPGELAGWSETVRIELASLGAEAQEQLVDAVLGGPVDGGVRADLVARAGGDVALLRALVESGVAGGALRRQGGVWSAAAPVEPGTEVRGLVLVRVRDLADGEREAASLLAVTGPMRIEVAAAVAGEAALEALEGVGLLRVEADRSGCLRVGLAVPVVAEVLAAEVPALRRRRWCGEVADRLDLLVGAGAAGSRDRLLGARLKLEAGRPLAPNEAVEAATDAWRTFDPSLTERFATAAVAAGAGFDAELLLARANAQLGDPVGADARLVALLASSDDDGERVAATMVRSELLLFFQDDAASAIAALEAVEPEIRDEAGRVQLAAKRGLLLHSTGDPVGALHLLEPLLEELDGDTLLLACFAVSVGATAVGRVRTALAACDRAEAAAPSGWDPMLVELSRLAALGLLGDIGPALDLARQRYDAAVAEGARHRQAWFAWARGGLLLDQGRVADAVRWCAESRALLVELGQRPAERLVANDLARALALLGRPGEAEAVLAETDAGPGEGRPGLFGDDAVRRVATAWIAAAQGDLPGARDRLVEAAERFEGQGQSYPALHAWVDVARLGDPARARPEVVRLSRSVEGELAAAQMAFVIGLADGDGDALEAAADRLASIGRHLGAAEALAAAARGHERAGAGRRAASAGRRSAELAVRCGGLRSPSLASPDESALSGREREVALLAAHGRSNKQIAEHLVLSVRTVETHLQRSYVKLGITRRDELAAVLAVGPA